jgi:hypothetical protein
MEHQNNIKIKVEQRFTQTWVSELTYFILLKLYTLEKYTNYIETKLFKIL